MADEKTAAGFAEASRNLSKVTGELREFNLSAGREIADQMGKEITKVTDPFVNAFQTIPGVQTLGAVGKTIFNKTFAALKDKREKELLRQRLGITKEEFELLQKQKNVIDAQNEYQKKFDEATTNLLGLNEVEIRGLRNDLGQFLNFEDAVDRLIDINQESIDADADRHAYLQKGASRRVEKENEEARKAERQLSALESMHSSLTEMNKSITESLKGLGEKGLMGLGGFAAIFAAPFAIISGFFSQLTVELKYLDKLTKGGLGKIFAPVRSFFTRLGTIFKPITQIFKNIGKIFAPITKIAKGSASFMSGFSGVMRFAATIGRTLGKIFLPITVLMGVFDFVTGFMEGYKEDGIVGGIKEGIISVVDGLVGGLLRMITGAFAWILEAIGLDNFAASLTENVNDAIEGVYEIFRGVIDVIMFPFKLVFEMIKGIFGGETDFGGLFAGLGDSVMGIFDGVFNIITAPFDMIYGLIKDVFSFFGFELPDFDIGETILGFIGDAYDFVKNKVKGFFSFLGFGSEEEDLEKDVRDADKRLGIEERRVGIYDRAGELDSEGGQRALERYGTALDESIAAEEALEAFRNAPKLADVIAGATEKTKEVFGSISSSVSAGFSSAVNFVTDLFSFSSEDATVAGVATKLLDIILAPYNLAINFLRGIFGFGEDEEGNELPSFSIGELLVETMTNIFNWFSNLLDIDVGALVKKIPGAGKVIDFLFGDETAEDRIADQQALVDKLQRDVDTDRFYESDAQKERDKVALAEAMAELEAMRTEAGMVTVVNNNNVVNANTSNNASTTTIAPMRDTSPPAGSIPAYG